MRTIRRFSIIVCMLMSLGAIASASECSVYDVSAKDRKEGLWGVSKKVYAGNPSFNYAIARANIKNYPSLEGNPDLIKPGWSLSIPCQQNVQIAEKSWRPATTAVPAVKMLVVKQEAKVNVEKIQKLKDVTFEFAENKSNVSELKLQLTGFVLNRGSVQQSEPLPISVAEMPLADLQSEYEKSEVLTYYPPPSAFAKNEVEIEQKQQANGQEGNMFGKILNTAIWPFKKIANRRTARVALMALAFAPVPGATYLSQGGLVATSFAQQGTKTTPISVAAKKDLAKPTLQEVEAGGQKPYNRYAVIGELKLRSNSIFSQPPYEKNKKEVGEMAREFASSIGLAGAVVVNEWPGKDMSPEVILSGDAVIIGIKTEDSFVPLYLADCEYKGKPWANRIKIIQMPEVQKTDDQTQPKPAEVQTPVVVNPQAAQITNNLNVPPVINLNLTGLPSQPRVPTNTTQRIIYEVKRDWAAKWRDVGVGTGVALMGTAAQTFAIRLPNAMKYRANKDVDIAKIKAQGMVDAAKNRVSDVMNITNNSSSASDSKSDSNSQGATTGAVQVTANGGNSSGAAVGNITSDASNSGVTATGGAGGAGGAGGDSFSTSDADAGSNSVVNNENQNQNSNSNENLNSNTNANENANNNDNNNANSNANVSNAESTGGSLNIENSLNPQSQADAAADAAADADADSVADAAASAAASGEGTGQNNAPDPNPTP